MLLLQLGAEDRPEFADVGVFALAAELLHLLDEIILLLGGEAGVADRADEIPVLLDQFGFPAAGAREQFNFNRETPR